MVTLQVVVLILATFARPSRAVYCICKDGASQEAMQKDIDYACGYGADCSDILPSGPCYEPNTVKDHCNYAVNSYFQRKAQVAGSCDFSGSATTSAVIQNQVAGCVYPSSPSSSTGTGMTPAMGTPPATGTGMTPTMGTPPATGSGMTPSMDFPPPTGSGMTPSMDFPPPTGSGMTPSMDFPPPTGSGMTPMTDFPPPTGTGMTPTTDSNNGATSMTLGKGTLFVVLLIVARILG